MNPDGNGYPTTGPFAEQNMVGGDGGKVFTECHIYDGLLVRGLTVWANDRGLQGIIVDYTDGSSCGLIGSKKGDAQKVSFDANETITECTLWGNGTHERCGHIVLKGSANHNLDHGKNVKGQDSFPSQTQSGILAGICGRADTEINMLGLIFLRQVDSQTIGDVKYGDLPKPGETGSPQGVNVDSKDITNQTSGNIQWNFANSVSRKQVYSHTVDSKWAIGGKISAQATFSAGIPVIAQVKATVTNEFHWDVSKETTDKTENTDESAASWSLSGVIKPGQHLRCTAWMAKGETELTYQWTRTLHFTNTSDTLPFTESGKFKKTEYSSVQASVVNANGKQVAGDPGALPPDNIAPDPTTQLKSPDSLIQQPAQGPAGQADAGQEDAGQEGVEQGQDPDAEGQDTADSGTPDPSLPQQKPSRGPLLKSPATKTSPGIAPRKQTGGRHRLAPSPGFTSQMAGAAMNHIVKPAILSKPA